MAHALDPRPWPISQMREGECSRFALNADRDVRDPHAGMRELRRCGYGTILVAGSLQGLWPAALTAATRNQMREPDGKPCTVNVDLVGNTALVCRIRDALLANPRSG